VSASIGIKQPGWFGRLFGIFRRPKDPITKGIYDAMAVLDRMINSIEATKKSLKSMREEHSRRAKFFASEGRKEYEDIFMNEIEHIQSLILMFNKVQYDLMRVRYRLETLTLVEEPMRQLPEVIQELQALKPEVEKIAPELSTMLLEVERKVTSIMTSSNMSSALNALSYTKNKVENEASKLISETQQKILPPLPPETTPVAVKVKEYSPVPLPLVKKWIIEEIKMNGGVFVVRDFANKYRVPKHIVYDALKKLEEEGLIKLKR